MISFREFCMYIEFHEREKPVLRLKASFTVSCTSPILRSTFMPMAKLQMKSVLFRRLLFSLRPTYWL